MFMPVGTKGTLKGLTSKEIENLKCQIFLCNTYHLANKPTGDLLEKFNGIHNFILVFIIIYLI